MANQERRMKRMRKRAETAHAYPTCVLPDGMWCTNNTRGHWHTGPSWAFTTAAEIRAAEGLEDA